MKLIFSHSICKKEFSSLVPHAFDQQVIVKALHKGIHQQIKGDELPGHSRLLKAYCTTSRGVRRVVFLFFIRNNSAALLFYRNKNDKIGKNITIKNIHFKNRLSHYLDLLEKDLDSNSFSVIDL